MNVNGGSEDVLDVICLKINKLNSWKGEICVPTAGGLIEDIMQYTDPILKNEKVVRMYFPAEYSDLLPFGEQWKKLYQLIGSNAFDSGTELSLNGYTGEWKRIECKFCHASQSDKPNKDIDSSEYRSATMTNDRQNCRKKKKGMILKKRTSTHRLLRKEQECSFGFLIGYDPVCHLYFLPCGHGCQYHSHHPKIHPKLLKKPTRFINPKEAAILQSVKKCGGNHAVSRNLLLQRTGDLISRSQIRTLSGLSSTVAFHFEQQEEKNRPESARLIFF